MFDRASRTPPSAQRPAPAQKRAPRAPGPRPARGMARPPFNPIRPLAGAPAEAQPKEPGPQPEHQPPNRTGLPDKLKAGVEALSGLSMDDVRVHRNSAEPAKLGALAYAKGSDIHLGPGQEQHLPHEAWHVVQQKQGRVHTLQMKSAAGGQQTALEVEADVMGSRTGGTQKLTGPPAVCMLALFAEEPEHLQNLIVKTVRSRPELWETDLFFAAVSKHMERNLIDQKWKWLPDKEEGGEEFTFGTGTMFVHGHVYGSDFDAHGSPEETINKAFVDAALAEAEKWGG